MDFKPKYHFATLKARKLKVGEMSMENKRLAPAACASFQGRLRVIKYIARERKFSLDIGSKNVRFGDVNLDIDKNCHPDIVTDCNFYHFNLVSLNGYFSQMLWNIFQKVMSL